MGYNFDTRLPILGDSIRQNGAPYATGLAYSSTSHSLFFTSGSGLYRNSGGAITTITSSLVQPGPLALDANDTAYIIDFDHVSSVTTAGVVHQLTPAGSINQIGGTQIGYPHIAYDSGDGNLYVTDPLAQKILRVSMAGQVTTVAGSCVGQIGYGTCFPSYGEGQGSGAYLNDPSGIAYDPANGLLYFADTNENEIWSLTTSGIAKIVAGYGLPGNADGNGRNSLLLAPTQIIYEPDSQSLLFMEYWTGGFRQLATLATTGSAQPAFVPNTQVFTIPTIDGNPGEATVAPDNSLWFTENAAKKIAHMSADGATINEYPIPSGTAFNGWDIIVLDANGNAWTGGIQGLPPAAGPMQDGLVRVDPAGNATFVGFPVGTNYGAGQVDGLTLGPNGNVWFSDHNTQNTGIGFVAPDLSVHRFIQSTAFNATPYYSIAFGSDGALWAMARGAFDRFDLQGNLLSSQALTNYLPLHFIENHDGNIWWTDAGTTTGFITPAGTITAFQEALGCSGCFTGTRGFTAGPDGAVWQAENNLTRVSRVDAAGTFSNFYLPAGSVGVNGVAARTDGKVWITAFDGNVFLLDIAAYRAFPLLAGLDSRRRPQARDISTRLIDKIKSFAP